MSEEDRAYVAQRKDEVEELRARCRGLEQLLTAYEQSRGKELERVAQLEEALEKIASAYRNMTLRERLAGEPSPARLVNIAAAALSREPSEAPEKEEEEG